MPDHTDSFDNVCSRLHALMSRIGRIDRLRQYLRNNPNHRNHEKLTRQLEGWEKALSEDVKQPSNLGVSLEKKREKDTSSLSLEHKKHLEDKEKEDRKKDDDLVFEAIDKNHNGEITLTELQSAMTSAVGRFHINSDRLLCGWTIPELFRGIDTDCSGKISLYEWSQRKQGKAWTDEVSKAHVREKQQGYTDEQIDDMIGKWGNRLGEDSAETSATSASKVKADLSVSSKNASKGTPNCSASASNLEASAQDMLKAQFRKWDTDRKGFISKQQLCQLLKVLNPLFRDDDLDHIMDRVDKNGNGQVEYEEFVDFIFHQEEILEDTSNH